MRTCRLADSWRSGDHHGSVYIRAVLPGLLETGLQAARPVDQPLLKLLDLTFVATYLLERLGRISNGPQLSQGIDGPPTTQKC